MRKLIALVLALVCLLSWVSCKQKENLQQGNNKMQYFFTAKVVEVHEEYLLLEVFDIGNTNLSQQHQYDVTKKLQLHRYASRGDSLSAVKKRQINNRKALKLRDSYALVHYPEPPGIPFLLQLTVVP